MKFIERTNNITVIEPGNISQGDYDYIYLYDSYISINSFTFRLVETSYCCTIYMDCNESTNGMRGGYMIDKNIFQRECFIPFSKEVMYYEKTASYPDFYHDIELSEQNPLLVIKNGENIIFKSMLGNTTIQSIHGIIGHCCGLNIWKILNDNNFIKFVDIQDT